MNRYSDLIDRLDGYTIGTICVDTDAGTVELALPKGGYMTLTDAHHIEVAKGGEYLAVTIGDALTWLDDEGWPLLGGLYCRVK